MDKKTWKKIQQDDNRTMLRFQKILSFVPYGFHVFLHKKGYGVRKEVSKYCLREFTFLFPTLDSAIFYMEGYCHARNVPGEGQGESPDKEDEGKKPYQPKFH